MITNLVRGIPITDPTASPIANVFVAIVDVIAASALVWLFIYRRRKKLTITSFTVQAEGSKETPSRQNLNRGFGLFACGVLVVSVIVGLAANHEAVKNNDGTPLAISLASAKIAKWYPASYQIDASLNTGVAWEVLSPEQAKGQPCVWCSVKHGYYFWKVNFIAENGCSDLYINTEIEGPSGNLIGYWYQKGGTVARMQPEELEIVAHNSTDTFKVTQISCT